MRMPKFRDTFGPVSIEAVNAAENRLGVTFPADYKQFLCSTNGGYLEPQEFLVPDRGLALAAILYGVRSERIQADLEYEQEQATLWDPLPPGYVAIGHDPGGNTFLLATLGANLGHVFFWDLTGLWVREDGRNGFLIATSFTVFMESLHDSRESYDLHESGRVSNSE
jgi:hypothetical protein